MKRIALIAVLMALFLGITTQMSVQTAHAGGEDANTGTNGLPRRQCESFKGSCSFFQGESVDGVRITINGTRFDSCHFDSAPANGTVEVGVINFWSAEIGTRLCGAQPAQSSATINGLARHECPDGTECAVNPGEAALAQSVWFGNTRFVNCFVINAPSGVVIRNGGVVNFRPGEPERTNAGRCAFSQQNSGTGIIVGTIPQSGFALVVFGGGSTMDLVRVSGCPETAVFWTTNSSGTFDMFISPAPAFINAQWNARFANGIPPGTAMVARCR